MPGINKYFEFKAQYRNLHEAFEQRKAVNFSYASTKLTAPCIFLSHRSTDKEAVRKIGEYIMKKGIDVFLDADDPNLQAAVAINDHRAITAAIDLGVANSTDLLAFLTKNSMSKESSSVWVPYEIGFAKRHGNYIAAIKSNDLETLPSYLEIVRSITGIETLNDYLREVLKRESESKPMSFSNYVSGLAGILKETADSTHPLSAYLEIH